MHLFLCVHALCVGKRLREKEFVSVCERDKDR